MFILLLHTIRQITSNWEKNSAQDMWDILTLKNPRKPASENVVCLRRLLNILANFQAYFCIQANSVDLTAPRGAVGTGSTLFAKITFKITSR